MFKIETGSFGRFRKIRLVNTQTKEYVSIIPEFGGNVNEIVLNKNGKNYSIIDGARNYSQLIGDKRWFKSAKLIPFPNRIKDGRYCFAGKRYQLPINFPSQNHAIHGFIWDRKLSVKKKTITNYQASVQLAYLYDGSMEGYPFRFRAIITCYLLKDKGFKCTTMVKNMGACPLPIGDGWHPYFKTKGKADSFMLKIPSKRKIEVNARMIPTGRIIPFERFSRLSKIGKIKLDTGFCLKQKEGLVCTEIYDPGLDLKINVWQETGKWKYNYLQIFIPPARTSIAVEPMTCWADAFNNKKSLIILKPKQSFKTTYGVSLG